MPKNTHTQKALEAYALSFTGHQPRKRVIEVAVAPRYINWLKKHGTPVNPHTPDKASVTSPNRVTLALRGVTNVGSYPEHTYIVERMTSGFAKSQAGGDYVIRKVGQREGRDGFLPTDEYTFKVIDMWDVVHHITEPTRRQEMGIVLINGDWCIFWIESEPHQFEFKMKFDF